MVTSNGGPGGDFIPGTDANDILNGLGGNDTIQGLAGNDVIDGGDDHDRIFGGRGDDRLIGGDGNDELKDVDGIDTLIGVELGVGSDFGKGEVDLLASSQGRYVLGNAERSFYDDGRADLGGRRDYALIDFFNDFTHKIELQGSAQDYILRNITINEIGGIGIFRDTNGSRSFNRTDELIALVDQVSGRLDLNSSNFVYLSLAKIPEKETPF